MAGTFETTSFGGGLPAMEVEVVEQEIRRIGRRMAPPKHLRYIDERGTCRKLALYFMAPDCESFREARICDIGVGGFAIAVPMQLELGEEADLIARDPDRGNTFFEEHVLIRNQRPQRIDFKGRAANVYGLTTLAHETSPLYKCILDSIFLSHVAEQSGEEDIIELPFNPAGRSN